MISEVILGSSQSFCDWGEVFNKKRELQALIPYLANHRQPNSNYFPLHKETALNRRRSSNNYCALLRSLVSSAAFHQCGSNISKLDFVSRTSDKQIWVHYVRLWQYWTLSQQWACMPRVCQGYISTTWPSNLSLKFLYVVKISILRCKQRVVYPYPPQSSVL